MFFLPLLFLLSSLTLTFADCSGRQSYIFSIKFNFTRSADFTLPEKTQIPILVAVTHKSNFKLFERTQRVRDDVAEIALRRTADKITQTFEKEKKSGQVSDYDVISDIDPDGSTRFDLVADEGANTVSFMAAMLPSPAWFIGLDRYSLCANGTFLENQLNVKAENFDSGLTDGSSWTDQRNPFPDGESQPVGDLNNIDKDTVFATLELEKGSLGVDWWKIFLGVLVGVAVVLFLFLCVIPRLRRRKKHQDIPLTAPDGVQW